MPDETAIADFMAQARKRFENAASDEKALRDEAERDLRFIAGDQWEPRVKQKRIDGGRPVLTFSRCHTFVQQVSNEARQNKPQIKFVPPDNGDPETAEVLEGLARAVQYSSDASVAYETAIEYSAGGGFGYFRYTTDFCDDDSFDQELKVEAVFDPFTVYGILIPACFNVEPNYGFIIQDMPKGDYKALYPKSQMATSGFEVADICPGWIDTETVRIAEYWYVEQKQEVLEREGRKRTVTRKVVKCSLINGLEVLEETEWLGSTIPIIPVLGKQLTIKGKPQLASVIRHQLGAQQLINAYKSRIAETLGTAPIQPYLVARGQITDEQRPQWNTLNETLRPYIEYETVDVNGKPLSEPRRQVFEPPIVALSAAAQQEVDDMKATAGIYDASLGARSNSVSGIAKQKDQEQANVTNMHFLDNLERAFKKGGKVLEEVLPKVYDTPRIISILGADEQPKMVRINEPFKEGEKQKHFNIGGEGYAKYRAVITMGRSFSTKRQESFDTITQILSANPQLINVIGDIWARNSDMAGADELAERFKKMLPPNLQDKDESAPQIPPEVEAQMQAMGTQLQQLTAALSDAQQAMAEKRIEQETKIKIAEIDAQKSVTVAEITTKAQNDRVRAELEADILQMVHSALQDAGVQARDHEHDMAMTVMDQRHQQELADQQTQNQAALAEQGAGHAMQQQSMAALQQPAT